MSRMQGECMICKSYQQKSQKIVKNSDQILSVQIILPNFTLNLAENIFYFFPKKLKAPPFTKKS